MTAVAYDVVPVEDWAEVEVRISECPHGEERYRGVVIDGGGNVFGGTCKKPCEENDLRDFAYVMGLFVVEQVQGTPKLVGLDWPAFDRNMEALRARLVERGEVAA